MFITCVNDDDSCIVVERFGKNTLYTRLEIVACVGNSVTLLQTIIIQILISFNYILLQTKCIFIISVQHTDIA